MFETAELGQKVSKKEFQQEEPLLREQLLMAQVALREADFPVIILFAGVDGAGKGACANLLSEWLDTRQMVTRAFGDPSDEEAERPEYWRFWRDLPGNGKIGVFLSAWYSRPILDRVYEKSTMRELDDELDRILWFERALANDGALILKFWMHLGEKAQRKRLKALEADPVTRWRVTKRDWKHWRMYDRFVAAAEHTLMRTGTGRAPWMIVEGADPHYRSLKVGSAVLEALTRRLAQTEPIENDDNGAPAAPAPGEAPPASEPGAGPRTVLDALDMSKTLTKKDYKAKLKEHQARLNLLHRKARDAKVTTFILFEGWDAAGKGGAIRRITPALDARDYQVQSIAAPTDEERVHHYLWRFWRHLPRAGRVMIFDRTWYGRVLVERVEEFARQAEWRRAYAEINEFERQLVDHGIVIVKFWIHITPDEQEARFKAREEIPYKRWKLTEEDWRNRAKWPLYEQAVHDMIERTSTMIAPWNLIEGNDKHYARVKVLDTVCSRLEKALG